MSVRTISASELYQKMQAGGVELIDVRTPAEYESVHATGAQLVPLDRFDAAAVLAARNGRSGQPLYLICKLGSRSEQACKKLAAAGFAGAVSVEGGTVAWERAGLPVERGHYTLPLDRQVQLGAGSFLATGMLLGWLVHPGFYAVGGIVAAGLLTAGTTGFCAMGEVLARMPWNRRGGRGGAGSSCCSSGQGI